MQNIGNSIVNAPKFIDIYKFSGSLSANQKAGKKVAIFIAAELLVGFCKKVLEKLVLQGRILLDLR